jgi:O-glycosyl hydrolase
MALKICMSAHCGIGVGAIQWVSDNALCQCVVLNQLLKGNKMLNVMDNLCFEQYVYDVAKQASPLAQIEYFNGTLFVTGCTAREASKMQTAFECSGVGVVVTPGTEYSFDFV